MKSYKELSNAELIEEFVDYILKDRYLTLLKLGRSRAAAEIYSRAAKDFRIFKDIAEYLKRLTEEKMEGLGSELRAAWGFLLVRSYEKAGGKGEVPELYSDLSVWAEWLEDNLEAKAA